MQKLANIKDILIIAFLCIGIAIYIKNNLDRKDDLRAIHNNEKKLKKTNDSLNLLLQSDRKIRIILFKQKDSIQKLLTKEREKVKLDTANINQIAININKLTSDSTFKLFNQLYVQDSIAHISK